MAVGTGTDAAIGTADVTLVKGGIRVASPAPSSSRATMTVSAPISPGCPAAT